VRRIDMRKLHAAASRLGDVVIDPNIWPELMEEICASLGACGAALLQTDVRTPDVPRTAAVDGLFNRYFKEGWHERDSRVRCVPLFLQGLKVVSDQDLFGPDELRRDPLYNEVLYPNGLGWFAGVPFYSGSSLWALSIQRTIKEGPFLSSEKNIISGLSDKMTSAATLSKIVGQRVLLAMTDALSFVDQPALTIDRGGIVIAMNHNADGILGEDIKITNGRLHIQDQATASRLEALIERMTTTPDALPSPPLAVRRRSQSPIVLRAYPIPAASRSPFMGARALITLTALGLVRSPEPDVLIELFALTPAEARLAAVIARGISLRDAANELGIARETARNQLKSIFAKTHTHRQSELVALLSR